MDFGIVEPILCGIRELVTTSEKSTTRHRERKMSIRVERLSLTPLSARGAAKNIRRSSAELFCVRYAPRLASTPRLAPPFRNHRAQRFPRR